MGIGVSPLTVGRSGPAVTCQSSLGAPVAAFDSGDMTVLVSAASKHGSTADIAQVIARVIGEHGLLVDVRSAEAVSTVEAYDAAVLGSAVYAGHWLEPARKLVETHAPGPRGPAGVAVLQRPGRRPAQARRGSGRRGRARRGDR